MNEQKYLKQQLADAHAFDFYGKLFISTCRHTQFFIVCDFVQMSVVKSKKNKRLYIQMNACHMKNSKTHIFDPVEVLEV